MTVFVTFWYSFYYVVSTSMSDDAVMQLLTAANNDDLKTFRSLLEKQEALVNTKFPIFEETPLILCIKNKRSPALIDLLLDHKALKVDAVDGTERNALHAAVPSHLARTRRPCIALHCIAKPPSHHAPFVFMSFICLFVSPASRPHSCLPRHSRPCNLFRAL